MKLWPECLMWYNLWYPLKNIWKWRKSIINSRPWDYQGVYLLLHDQLSYMEESIRLYSYHTNKEEDCHNIKICLNLLDRLIEDEYLISKEEFEHGHDWNKYLFGIKHYPKYFLPRGEMYKLTDGIEKHDKELLFKILRRKLQSWWH